MFFVDTGMEKMNVLVSNLSGVQSPFGSKSRSQRAVGLLPCISFGATTWPRQVRTVGNSAWLLGSVTTGRYSHLRLIPNRMWKSLPSRRPWSCLSSSALIRREKFETMGRSKKRSFNSWTVMATSQRSVSCRGRIFSGRRTKSVASR